MGYNIGNDQRQVMHMVKGIPPVGLDFEVYADGHLAMWSHINHSLSFEQVKDHLLAMRDHLDQFIASGDMCPYHPLFKSNIQKSERA